MTSDKTIRPDNEPSETSSAGRVKVLLVDDYEINRKIAAVLLDQFGLEITEASGGEEAFERFSAERFGLVLMDINMPDLDGYETTRRMRLAEAEEPLWGRTPIIAFSSTKKDADYCLEFTVAGMDDCLFKPAEPEELKEVLQRWSPGGDPGGSKECDAAHTQPAQLEKVESLFDGRQAAVVALENFNDMAQSRLSLMEKAILGRDFKKVALHSKAVREGARGLVAMPTLKAADELAKLAKRGTHPLSVAAAIARLGTKLTVLARFTKALGSD